MIKNILKYCPSTGEITYIHGNSRVRAGGIAGTINAGGYRIICVNRKMIYGHRLAVFFMTGEFPPKAANVDHINGNRSDNRWENLRVVTPSINGHNRHGLNKNNTSGIAGVVFYKNAWCASVKVNRKDIYLGRFKTKELAAEARQQYREEVGLP